MIRLLSRIARRGIWAAPALAVALAVGFSPVHAQTAQNPLRWKMVSNNRTIEIWVWQKWLADEMTRRSNGRIQVEMVSLPELGLTGFELVRVMRGGLVDVGEIVAGYVAGDIPMVEGPSLTGLQPDWGTSQKSQQAWEEIYRKNEARIGGKYLGSHPYDWNAVYCSRPIRRLEDVKGLKVRVFSPAAGLFWKSLGAEPVSMEFAEVYSAMERKVLDCVQTAPAYGISAKLHEVAKYLVDLRFGHQPGLIFVSRKSWEGLPKDLQSMLVELGKEYTDRSWKLGRELTDREIKRNQGVGIEWIPMKTEYNAPIQTIVQNVVVPDWIRRVREKEEAAKAFNEHLAPLVGFTLK